MEIKLLKTDLKPTSIIDFQKLNKDEELRKRTIKIIGCGLCNYKCKDCLISKF